MNIHYFSDYYNPPALNKKARLFKEIKKESEYKSFLKHLKEWDRKDINTFQILFLQTMKYFNNFPCASLEVKDFLELFEISRNFIFYDLSTEDTRWIIGPDEKGNCLQINFLHTHPYTSIVRSADIPSS